MTGRRAEEFLADHPLGLEALAWVRRVLAAEGPVTERVGKSQVAFRRSRGFAYLWLPGQYLARPTAEVVLSLALSRPVDVRRGSSRWCTRRSLQWMHHLELRSAADLDDEVEAWLRSRRGRDSAG